MHEKNSLEVTVSASVQCPVCKLCESDDEDNTSWVLCDNPECGTWYHVDCVRQLCGYVQYVF